MIEFVLALKAPNAAFGAALQEIEKYQSASNRYYILTYVVSSGQALTWSPSLYPTPQGADQRLWTAIANIGSRAIKTLDDIRIHPDSTPPEETGPGRKARKLH